MTAKNQKVLYRYGRVGCFVYSEGNPFPLDLDHETSESATYDKSLLEQRFTDLFFEKPQNDKLIMTLIIIAAVVVIGGLILYIVLKSKGG